VALGMSACALVFKLSSLSIASGVLWLIMGIACTILQQGVMVTSLGIMGILLAIVMFFTPAMLRQQIEPPKEPTYHERMSARIEARRHKYDSFRPKVKEPYL